MNKYIFKVSDNNLYKFKKFKKDTDLALFVFGPLLLIFWIFLGLYFFNDLIFRIIILVPTMILIVYGFFITRLRGRGKIIQRLCKTIIINDHAVTLESFNWFHLNSRKITIKYDNLLLKNDTLNLLNYNLNGVKISSNIQNNGMILLEEFFEDLEEIIKILKIKKNSY